MSVRAVRGATTVESNTSEEIVTKTKELLAQILKNNSINTDDIVSIFFTSTQDLTADYPAKAARELGLVTVPLMGSVEADVPYGLKLCIRIMLHFNTSKSQKDIKHIYLNGAKVLRPDIYE